MSNLCNIHFVHSLLLLGFCAVVVRALCLTVLDCPPEWKHRAIIDNNDFYNVSISKNDVKNVKLSKTCPVDSDRWPVRLKGPNLGGSKVNLKLQWIQPR
jgi:hypothetical protein